MRFIYSKHFPPKDFGAINLFGLIIVRKDYGSLTRVEQNHEQIHTQQMMEMLFVVFYLFYIIEWLVRLIQYRDRMKAYQNISFEREAYACMYDLSYLKKRKLFAFRNYYRKKG
ncbi:hypothetical protein [Prevotella sp. 10(H)]|uniref:hypothetical protein n=1 Tax=Prevotella sp. 10(H) TaxID=1158294 RepID=UPI0004A739DB|nr:hypothetical protein [Prevotella sp. 10(H)]